MKKFIGRREELKQLNALCRSDRATMVVLKGRRRIGKSRLAMEFAKDKTFITFTGIAPVKDISKQDQLDEFAKQLYYYFKLPPITFKDWSDAFANLSIHLNHKPTVILLDEITWMGDQDPTFLPKLQVWWDLSLQKCPNITLILCGSVSIWIEKNIINSTAFFGRISLTLNLEELTLAESNQFLQASGIKCSRYDIFKILAIIGGVPWYLEQLDAEQTIDDNIKRLCFQHNGLLVNEFNLIFNDLFSSKGIVYKKIIHILSDGMKSLADIREELKYPNSGRLTEHLQLLITSGFVTKHYQWSFKTGKIAKQSLYRLADNYLRFYIKYIEPNISKIDKKSYNSLSLSKIPGWDSMMGFQLESLLLKNRHLMLKSIEIDQQDIVADNPYFQKATNAHQACQIDYLIQTYSNNLYVCEMKFQRKEVNLSIVDAMKDKIKRFIYPKGFGICPILFYLDNINEEITSKRYFYRTIDIGDFLEEIPNQ